MFTLYVIAGVGSAHFGMGIRSWKSRIRDILLRTSFGPARLQVYVLSARRNPIGGSLSDAFSRSPERFTYIHRVATTLPSSFSSFAPIRTHWERMDEAMRSMLLESRAHAMRRSAAVAGWRLTGARVATGAATSLATELTIINGRLRDAPSANSSRRGMAQVRTMDLTGYMILPGLVNTHDHLEFGLFPRLGHGPYQNFQEWSADIYHPNGSPLKELLSIPKSIRLWWGAVRNLLCGVTTVCHHNPQIPSGLRALLPVRIVSRYTWAHSLALGKNVTETFRSTPADTPFIIHVAEGVDEQSRAEIFCLDRMGVLDPKTVIVHGVGMERAGHELLERRGSALVWCPTSNQFLLGRTLDLATVRHHRRIALASDSALTAAGDLLDEIRFVRAHSQATAEEVYAMVTNGAADVLRL